MGPEVNIKELPNLVYEEGKKLPRPIWIAALILPFGLNFVGAYLILKTVMEKKK